ncbi:hypothetical protein EZS27_043615 [termite gut metagenome]|uniref:Uncharacterized protein n=1 Tax=termite gut metagenome TaxID=433724 RepID=A0A5J4P5Q6_9ZZZZ
MGGGSPRSSTTAFGLSQTVSLLMEIRGVGIGKTSFTRRVYSSYLVALETLKTSCNRSSDLKSAMDEAGTKNEHIVVTTNFT